MLATPAVLVCSCGWNPSRPFDRNAPAVSEAIADLDGGDATAAAGKLEDYLSTGACKDGNIGAPEGLKRRADGTFDLGLSLFHLGERYGLRFGEEEIEAGVSEDTRTKRHAQVECARRVVQAIADDLAAPSGLRAQASYLEGNLDFLDGAYEEAVKAYDRTLVLSPGEVDGGDPVGRDAAWNRAIALRRIDDKKDSGSDASQDSSDDAPHDGGKDASQDASRDSGGGDGSDRPDSSGGGPPDSGPDAPSEAPDAAPPPSPEAGAPPPPTTSEDERMLDQLESAPTLQQEQAKRSSKKRVRGMADK